MNWITRCPACRTCFKVVPDQIKMAQGWLRCGLCHQAFDSTGMVLAWPDVQPVMAAELTLKEGQLDIEAFLLKEDRSAESMTSTSVPSVTPVSDGPVTAAPVSASESTVASLDQALSTFQAAVFVRASDEPSASRQAEPVWPSPAGTLEGAVNANTAKVVATQATENTWLFARRRGSMAVMWVLILLWFSQVLWVTRQEWAPLAPSIAARLNAACIELGCQTLPPWVRDAVVIESSGWTPHAGGFVLSWSLRNAAAQSVAMPALELTLMDAQDQVLVRRVLDVEQLGAPAELKPGELWQAQRLIWTEAGLVPPGYRLLSFYP